jgi:hypothetical protein
MIWWSLSHAEAVVVRGGYQRTADAEALYRRLTSRDHELHGDVADLHLLCLGGGPKDGSKSGDEGDIPHGT